MIRYLYIHWELKEPGTASIVYSIIMMFVLPILERSTMESHSCRCFVPNQPFSSKHGRLVESSRGIFVHMPRQPYRASVISSTAVVSYHVTSFDAESSKRGYHDPQDTWKDNEKTPDRWTYSLRYYNADNFLHRDFQIQFGWGFLQIKHLRIQIENMCSMGS